MSDSQKTLIVVTACMLMVLIVFFFLAVGIKMIDPNSGTPDFKSACKSSSGILTITDNKSQVDYICIVNKP